MQHRKFVATSGVNDLSTIFRSTSSDFYGYASRVMNRGPELEIGATTSNSSRVRCIHLLANTIWKALNASLLPNYRLRNKTLLSGKISWGLEGIWVSMRISGISPMSYISCNFSVVLSMLKFAADKISLTIPLAPLLFPCHQNNIFSSLAMTLVKT